MSARLPLLILLAIPVAAHSDVCRPAAETVVQGNVIRLICSQPVTSARMNGRTVPLFKQSDGEWLALMPVAATDAPGEASIAFLSSDQQQVSASEVTIHDAHFATQNVNLAPGIANLHNSPEEIATLKAFRESLSDVRFWTERFEAPVPGCMISPFGVKRYRNHKPTGDYHGGLDLRAPAGEPIRAADDGIVRLAQPLTVLGNTVGLDHGQGVETMYLHMSKIAVQPGAQVKRGEVIGYAGSTGRANGPHLHWTLLVNQVQVNPAQWVTVSPCASTPSGKHHKKSP